MIDRNTTVWARTPLGVGWLRSGVFSLDVTLAVVGFERKEEVAARGLWDKEADNIVTVENERDWYGTLCILWACHSEKEILMLTRLQICIQPCCWDLRWGVYHDKGETCWLAEPSGLSLAMLTQCLHWHPFLGGRWGVPPRGSYGRDRWIWHLLDVWTRCGSGSHVRVSSVCLWRG